MRLAVPGMVGVGLAAALLGCAQVVGIEELSAGTPVSHCVDAVNMLRQDAGLEPVSRWTEEEPCAAQQALVLAFDGALNGMPIRGPNAPCVEGMDAPAIGVQGVSGPEDYLQTLVSYYWVDGGTLTDPQLDEVACGYAETSHWQAGTFILLFR